jgi:signal peptidase I
MARRPKSKTKRPRVVTWPLYVALVALFALYIYYQQVQSLAEILGALLFFLIIVLVVMELINSVGEEGYAKNIIELAIAVGAILLFWFAIKSALQTRYPLDVVPSCSMLPDLHRGDMIVLHGIKNLSQIKAPVIDVSAAAYQSMLKNIEGEELQCVAYNVTKGNTKISQTLLPGYSIGLYQPYPGGIVMPQGNQSASLITYTCGARKIMFDNGTTENEVYTSAITVAGTSVIGDDNNTVVVYQTTPDDYFYTLGDRYIVHRVYAVIDTGGNYYALTKGDNNAGLDIQYGNYPANESYVEGRVIASVPYIGYLKLILNNQFGEPAGCNSFPESN